MNKFKIRFFIFFLFICVLLITNVTNGEPLVVKKENELNIIYKGETFIKKDMLSLAGLSKAEFQSLGRTGEWDEVIVLKGGSKKDCIYYREVGYKPGKIEITWYIKYAPYQFGTDFPGHSYNSPGATYELKIPAEFLDGAHYKAVVGSVFKLQIKEGELSKDMPEGKIIEETIRYITFTKNGRPITLDLNPLGPSTGGYKDHQAEKDWRLTRDGKYFSLWSDMSTVKWGDAREFKIAITDREWVYEEIHTINRKGHEPYIYPTLSLIFGKKNPRASLYTMADCSLYNKEKGLGWEDNQEIKLIETDFESPIRKDYIKGGKKQNFLIDAKDGLYLVSLIFGSSGEESGLFNVYANDELKLKNLKTEKGDFAAKTIYTWADKGRIKLSFEGKDWMLNAFSLTPIVYNEEDYIFKRSFFIQQDRFDQWFSNVEVIPPMPDIIRKTPSQDRMDWTWNCPIENIGGSVDSSRAELDTVESLEQRFKLIKSGGFNAAIFNGLHYRYAHKDSIRNKIMLRNTRLTVEVAHRLGVKVIDHLDLNWIFYQGFPSMLKVLDKDPNCLQRNITYPLQIGMGFCLNSEEHLKEVVNYLIEEQKVTDIDGYMIDEESWMYCAYCACDKCRKMFYEDTGYKLPYVSEQDKFEIFYQDYGNKIWREYTEWKGLKTAECFGKIKKEVQKVYPGVIFLLYTSAALSEISMEGQELNKVPAWNADYIGDEFHSDDIIQNWRVMFERLKDRQGVVSSWGNYPTWILPRNLTHHDRILYAWAISRMTRGNLWYRAGDYPFSKKLNDWEYQMKDKYAKPISDVAVLLSQYTRDFTKDESYYHQEYAAWLQTLAEVSMQYDVILDRDIIFDKLKKYKVLVLANTSVLSDSEAEEIRKFVASGGSVIATYETGLFDGEGERREDSIFADIMNMKKLEDIKEKTKIKFSPGLAEGMEKTELETDIKQCAYQLIDKTKSRVLAETIDPAKNKGLTPAIVETPFGQGKLYYISGNFIRQNYEPRMASMANRTYMGMLGEGQTYNTHFNKDINKLVKNLLTLAIGEDYKTKAVKIPDGVIYAAFNQKYEGKESVLIHFLNCQGKPSRKYGEPLLLTDPIPQPPLPFDVELKIKSDSKIKEAFIVSPLKDEKTEVKINFEGNNCYLITVPKTAIENYAILYLNK